MPAALRALVCTAGALALLAPSAATQGRRPLPPDTTTTVPLDTVVVEALRTPLPVLRTPYATDVVRQEEIRLARPGLALSEALVGVPGVQVENRFNFAQGERISVRGFGARAQFGVRGVRVLLDGIPATLADGQTALANIDVASLGRVEVVRGPASALYGNASGGVIQLSTLPPPLVPLATEHRLVAGSDGLRRLESAVGGRSGSLGYRASVAGLRYGGFREHASAENLRGGANLRWERGADELRLVANLVRYDALNPGSLSDSLLRVDRSRAFVQNVTQQTGNRGHQEQIGAFWRRTAGAGVLELAGYGIARGIDNPIAQVVIALERRAGGLRASWSAESPLPAGTASWTAGASLDAQRDDRRNFANQSGERGALRLDQQERVTGAAIFAQATLPVVGRLDALGALRYDRFRFAVRDRFPEDGRDDSDARIMDAVSPSVGLSLRAAESVSLYANVATAFETPTTTELANRPSGAGGFNPELEPQRTVSYEAGAKARFGGAGLLTLAAYRARVRDALIPFEVEGAAGRQFFRNAGAAVH
ncbi:MAG: TonB-dependent receptor, partial [Gemmatimonadota bacterium]|nr:TonB-dependent receptor [Gemmatimonadota bacterium]